MNQKNDTEEEQCVNQEETDEDRRKPKKSRDHTWLCYFCLRRQTPLHQQKGVQISVPLKMKMSPSDQILAQTLTFSCQIQGNLSVASQSKNQSA